jgi:hypothetical protein
MSVSLCVFIIKVHRTIVCFLLPFHRLRVCYRIIRCDLKLALDYEYHSYQCLESSFRKCVVRKKIIDLGLNFLLF